MSITDETAKTISILVLEYKKTIIITVLAVFVVLFLFPIGQVVFLQGQQMGSIPSASQQALNTILGNQEVVKAEGIALSSKMDLLTSEFSGLKANMMNYQEDQLYVLRTMCSNNSKTSEQSQNCQKTKWVRDYEDSLK